MKKHLRALAVILGLLLALGLAAGAAVADAASQASYGEASVNGMTETYFYVTTNTKNASIVLTQNGEGTMKFNQVNQWGYTLQTRSRRCYAYYVLNSCPSGREWTYTAYPEADNYALQGLEWSEKSYTLWFGEIGTYTVRVQSPANRADAKTGREWLNQNYPSSMAAWREETWTYIPSWSVAQQRGCEVSMYAPVIVTPTPVPAQQSALVTVQYKDLAGNILYAEQRQVKNAEYVNAPSTYAGYTLVSAASRKITVVNGKAYPDTVIFEYSGGGTSRKTADAWVTYVDQDTGKILYYYKVTLSEGNNSVYAPQSYNGYQLVTYSPMAVTLYSNGSFTPSQIVFYYHVQGSVITPAPTYAPYNTPVPTAAPYRPVTPVPTSAPTWAPTYAPTAVPYNTPIPTAVPTAVPYITPVPTAAPTYAPTATPAPAPTATPYTPGAPVYPPSTTQNQVYPTGWDTQFKPGTATAQGGANAARAEKLPNLYDEDPSTTFWWVVWNSERKDDIPELSMYFAGETVSAVGIRNGNTRSETTFYKYARPHNLRVVVTHDAGVDMVEIELSRYYSRDYTWCSLGRTFTGVTRIDFYLGDENTSGFFGGEEKENENVIHIADIIFVR